MDKEYIETLRMMHELEYRQIDSSAVVVVEMGEVDYETSETVRKYTSNGYKLFDSNRFGAGAGVFGEFLVFVKEKSNE